MPLSSSPHILAYFPFLNVERLMEFWLFLTLFLGRRALGADLIAHLVLRGRCM